MERKMADALDELYKDGVKNEIQNCKDKFNSKLEQKAPVNSPTFTGTPTAPTPAENDNSTKIATTAFVLQKIQKLIGSAPEVLDTLGEIANALKNNPDVINNILTQLGNKLDSSAASTYLTKTEASNTYAKKTDVPSAVDTSEFLRGGWFNNLNGNTHWDNYGHVWIRNTKDDCNFCLESYGDITMTAKPEREIRLTATNGKIQLYGASLYFNNIKLA